MKQNIIQMFWGCFIGFEVSCLGAGLFHLFNWVKWKITPSASEPPVDLYKAIESYQKKNE